MPPASATASRSVLEPVAEDTDVQYVLEFANAQLLELIIVLLIVFEIVMAFWRR